MGCIAKMYNRDSHKVHNSTEKNISAFPYSKDSLTAWEFTAVVCTLKEGQVSLLQYMQAKDKHWHCPCIHPCGHFKGSPINHFFCSSECC